MAPQRGSTLDSLIANGEWKEDQGLRLKFPRVFTPFMGKKQSGTQGPLYTLNSQPRQYWTRCLNNVNNEGVNKTENCLMKEDLFRSTQPELAPRTKESNSETRISVGPLAGPVGEIVLYDKHNYDSRYY